MMRLIFHYFRHYLLKIQDLEHIFILPHLQLISSCTLPPLVPFSMLSSFWDLQALLGLEEKELNSDHSS